MENQFTFKLITTYKAVIKRKRPSDYVPKVLRDITMEQYLQKKLVWSLYRDQHRKSYLDFASFGPADKLNDILTSEFVQDFLNKNDCKFDFEYTPTEGDLFNIRYEYVMKPIRNKKRLPIYDEYMTFLYQNDTWVADRMNDDNLYVLLAEGIAEFDAFDLK